MEDYEIAQAKVRLRSTKETTGVTIIEPMLGPPTLNQFLMDYPGYRLLKWTP